MSNEKPMIISLIVGLIKRTLYKMSKYFPKPYDCFGENVKVELDLSNYATKTDLKRATETDTSNLSSKLNLANLNTEVHKIDEDKLKTIPIDLSKLSNVANNEVVKKTVNDELVQKVNNIDTNGFVLKNKYDTDKSDLEKKINDADKKMPNISGRKKQIIMLKLLK